MSRKPKTDVDRARSLQVMFVVGMIATSLVITGVALWMIALLTPSV